MSKKYIIYSYKNKDIIAIPHDKKISDFYNNLRDKIKFNIIFNKREDLLKNIIGEQTYITDAHILFHSEKIIVKDLTKKYLLIKQKNFLNKFYKNKYTFKTFSIPKLIESSNNHGVFEYIDGKIPNPSIRRILEITKEINDVCNYSHGDFHLDNLIEYNNKIYIIDWDKTKNESWEYDFCHFYLIDCARNKTSYHKTKRILEKYVSLDKIEKIYKKIQNIREKSIILVLGPDGSGKTTIAKELEKQTEYKYYYGGSRNPATSFLKSRQKKEKKEYPLIIRKIRKTLSVLLLIYDGIIKLNSLNQKYILDRSIVDVFVQNNLPLFLLKLFKFDQVFLLNAPPDIIYQRKQELSKEQIQKQMEKYIKVTKILNGQIINNIDINKTISQITCQI